MKLCHHCKDVPIYRGKYCLDCKVEMLEYHHKIGGIKRRQKLKEQRDVPAGVATGTGTNSGTGSVLELGPPPFGGEKQQAERLP